MRTPHPCGVDRVRCKVGSSRGFSLSVSTPLLFASSSQIIRAHYHLIQAEWSSHYHLLSAENDDVIKQTLRCNQVATDTGRLSPAQPLGDRASPPCHRMQAQQHERGQIRSRLVQREQVQLHTPRGLSLRMASGDCPTFKVGHCPSSPMVAMPSHH